LKATVKFIVVIERGYDLFGELNTRRMLKRGAGARA